MKHDISPDVQSPTILSAMTALKSRHFILPRSHDLEKVFENVLAQFISSHLAGLHHEGRGLILTGGTRAGKSHDIKYLVRAFAENVDSLEGGFQRKYLRASLRTTTSWKHLGAAFLKGRLSVIA